MSIRHKAIAHLDAAIRLKELGDYDSLRYAVLELRYAIENLVYQLIPSYKSELPEEIETKAWRPKEILDAMVDCNPRITSSAILRFAAEDAQGKPGEFATMGKQTGLVPKELRDFYGRLGQFLHAKKDGSRHDEAGLARSVSVVIEFLEAYRRDSVIIDGFADRHSFTCTYCEGIVVRRSIALAESPTVTCPKESCHAVYEWKEGEGFQPLQEEFVCPACKEKGHFGRHMIRPDVRLSCYACSAEFELLSRLAIVPAPPKQR